MCGSTNFIKNGSNRLGHSNITAKCGVYRVLESRRETKKQKSLVLKAYQERISLRGSVGCLVFIVSPLPGGSESMWPLCRRSYGQRCCPPSPMMCSNSMRLGAAQTAQQALVVASWFASLMIFCIGWLQWKTVPPKNLKGAFVLGDRSNRVVAVYGTRCPIVSPLATSGKRIKRCCPKKPISQSAKAADSYPIGSVGIVHCDKSKPVMSAKRSHSQRAMRTIIWSPTGLSLTTTWR